ncbi:MAG TPA: hypothetical protein PK562_02475, partial [Candidatus Omnitrophota bacterium]|nr:hypothetical protein [Candidatus Omnitrophota bacterium]
MHKGVVCCCVISALSVYSSVLAQQSEEKLTITTYYPSPTGVYQTLRVAPGNNPADCSAAGAPEGKMYYDASGRVLLICSNSTIGGWGYYPVPGAGGLWALNGAHLTTANTTWDVGIGTTNPLARLHVVAPSSHMLQLQQNDSTTANQYSGVGWTSGTKQAYIFVMNDHNLGAAAGGFGGSGSMNLYTGVGGNITFYTNNSNN